MWKEFKKFAVRRNMLDLAVGVIIGGRQCNYADS